MIPARLHSLIQNSLTLQQIGRTVMVNKALGQHWLNNRAILNQIAELCGEGPLCVEIGPGLGTLTSSLLRRFKKVVAVEFDADLARKLPGSFPGKNLEVLNQDFLKYDLLDVPQPYVVAGNIPYYITSPIIQHILENKNLPEKVVLLIQKEVAERIVSERESLLSLRCKNRADVKLGPVVVASEFTPPPKVDSQVIVMTPHAPIVSEEVFELIEAGFSAPRKKVTRNLSVLMPREDIKDIFLKLNINIDVRPGELHLEDWQKIYNRMMK